LLRRRSISRIPIDIGGEDTHVTLAAIGVRALTAVTLLLRGQAIGWRLLWLGVVVGLAVPGTSGATQQFSADLVGTAAASGAAQTAGKIYVSNAKVRIETPDFPGGLFLVDGNAHTAYFVKPAQRVVMDAKQSSWLTQILVPLDPSDPCRQWQAMAEAAGATDRGGQWQCSRAGLDSASERNLITYRAISPQGASIDCRIDPQLGFVVSAHRDDGAAIDLENVQEEPLPAALFEVPANFLRFDPHQLIDRIKHSDVWLEPPK
jgi:hypothetical protein